MNRRENSIQKMFRMHALSHTRKHTNMNYRYTWKRNGIDFNPSGNDDRIVQLPGEGTLVINAPEDKDEGKFQCTATNQFGVSVSIMVNLR
jgi:hypothetical protein